MEKVVHDLSYLAILLGNLEQIFCLLDLHSRMAQVENQGHTRYFRNLDCKPFLCYSIVHSLDSGVDIFSLCSVCTIFGQCSLSSLLTSAAWIQSGSWNMLICSFVLFLLRGQRMIGFSKAMSPALVDNKFWQTPLKNWKKKKQWKFHYTWKKNLSV